jgi:site-specific recombinase XerC
LKLVPERSPPHPARVEVRLRNPNGASTGSLYGRYGLRSIHDLVWAAGVGAGVGGAALPAPLAPLLRDQPLTPGADIHVVQRLLGHSNFASTTRYLHLSDADLADAVDKAFPEE